MIEIITALYIGIMNIEPADLKSEKRDRFILSKGHCAISQYAALNQIGVISDEEIKTFKKNEAILHTHPTMNMSIGVEFSTGSLGQGLPFGVGTALALKRKANKVSRVFVLLGDGECDEGSVWEAVLAAAHHKLNNLVAIVDYNSLQYDGATDNVLSMSNLCEKFSSFCWHTVEVDGHSIKALLNVLSDKHDGPTAIIARTIKGKGVSFMENSPLWHNGRLSKAQFEQALAEQERI
jgi:transketolase